MGAEQIDRIALHWLDSGLDQALESLRQAFLDYTEQGDNARLLETVQEPLQLLHGALAMAGVRGGIVLLDELQSALTALAEGKTLPTEEHLETVMGGMLQVGGYLDYLRAGHADVPLVLLPLLNDLRSLRHAPLLAESSFLVSDPLSRIPDAWVKASADQLTRQARKLRPVYERALLGWFRGDAEARQAMAAVLDDLAVASHSKSFAALWKVAGGVLAALESRSLDAGTAVKTLFGRLSRELKRLSEQSEPQFGPQQEELLQNLLYYLGQARTDAEPVASLQTTFGLEVAPPSETEIEVARQQLHAPSLEMMANVADVVREETASLKDALDLFVRSKVHDPASLQPVVPQMRAMADTLMMLDLGQAADTLRSQAQAIESMMAGEQAVSEDALMGMATVLLQLDQAVDSLKSGQRVDGGSGGVLNETGMQDTLEVLFEDSLASLSSAKDILRDVFEASGKRARLAEVQDLMRQVRGGLQMIQLDAALPLLDGIRDFASRFEADCEAIPTARELDALGDIFASIEFYLENLRDYRSEASGLLEHGLEVLASLETSAGVPAETAEPEDDDEALTLPLVEMPETSVPVAEHLFGADVDDDIIEVFVEEAQEQETLIRSSFEAWKSDNHDAQALGDLRRGFHTLKGSGRLVGAEQVGEYAWAMENLLNGVIEGSRSADDQLLACVEEGVKLLPMLVGALQGEEELDLASLEQLASRAHALAQGEEAMDAQAAADEEMPAFARDPVLYDIFRTESDTHLRILHEHVGNAIAHDRALHCDDALIRAVHTLKGSAYTAEAHGVANLVARLELYLREMQSARRHVEGASLALLKKVIETVENTLDALAEQPLEPDFAELLQRLDQLIADIHPAEEAASPVPATSDLDLPEELDPELLEVFLEEAEELAVEADRALEAWKAEPQDGELVRALQRHLHTIKGGARMAGLRHIADLSHAIESVMERLADSTLMPTGQIFDGVRAAFDRIQEMLERVRGQQPIVAAVSELDALNVLLREEQGIAAEALPELSSVEPESLEAEAVDTAPAAIPAPSAEATVALEAMDPELLQVFLEEAEDITAQADADLQAWGDALTDRRLMQGLQRHLHTIKGGARMAGIQPIADLSHAIETVMEHLAEGGLEPGMAIRDTVRTAFDRIQAMLDQLRAHEPVSLATADLAALENLLSEDRRSAAAEAPAPAEPSAVTEAELSLSAEEETLLQTYLDEAAELAAHCDDLLNQWAAVPTDTTALQALQRELHTLKGGARMADLPAIADLSHATEALLEGLAGGEDADPSGLVHLTRRSLDALRELLAQAAQRQPLQRPQGLIETLEKALQDGKVEVPAPSEPGLGERPTAAPAAVASDARRSHIRVGADLIDRLVNFAGESSIYHARLEQQTHDINFNLGELDETVHRLRDKLRRLEIETETQILYRHNREQGESKETEGFDPLELDRFTQMQELSRSIMESMADIDNLQAALGDNVRDTETLLLQQNRVNKDLQSGLMSTRLVSFAGVVPRLHRIVRQTCTELGKKARLVLEGERTELDREVLEELIPALEHMLRNSLVHGLESPEERQARGKPAEGVITIGLSNQGSDVIVDVSDDGAGIDLQAVRDKAVRRGLLAADAQVDESELMQMVLEPGFSTAKEVTQLAGRGVGMDVVSTTIKQLGGQLGVESERGQGTHFHIQLPITLALTQAILVDAGEESYAIPFGNIEGITRIGPADLQGLYAQEQPTFQYGGREYSLHYLGHLLGTSEPQLAHADIMQPLFMVRVGDRRMAVHVDRLQGSREIFIKPLGPQLSQLRGLAGASILGDGRVVLILDMNVLMRPVAQTQHLESAQESPKRRMTVMVVDDSITIRKVTSRILERNNMEVVAARDGVDAIALLQETTPDVILTDIEMPRMDGFELAAHIRHDQALQHIPLVMITSRTAEKHRKRARNIGVNAYLGKPYTEAVLLETIEQVRDGQYMDYMHAE